jgi:Fe-S-cluster containining protein
VPFVEVEFRGARKTLPVIAPEGCGSPAAALPVLREFTDALVQLVSERQGELGHPVSCRAGCSACCRILVGASVWELDRLRRYVEEMPAPERVRARFDQTIDAVAEAGLLDRLRSHPALSAEDAATLAEKYARLQLPCPFLEDDRCSVYEERPLACRELIVTSDPALCGKAGGEVSRPRLPASMRRAFQALSGESIPLLLLFETEIPRAEDRIENWVLEAVQRL